VADLYFAHDSTLLPFVALMGFLNLGPIASSSRAARFCPFASRLLIEKLACGIIVVKYNDVVVRVFEGGMEEWREVYAYHLHPSQHSFDEICALDQRRDEL